MVRYVYNQKERFQVSSTCMMLLLHFKFTLHTLEVGLTTHGILTQSPKGSKAQAYDSPGKVHRLCPQAPP